MLLCPVRDCQLPLVREKGPMGRDRLVCAKSHSFDVARSGYVNLLQPQERRSKHPGDDKTIVAARRRLHDRGVTQPLLRAVAETAGVSKNDVVLDAGCGDGFYLGTIASETGCQAHGIDISIPAVDAAARRYVAGESETKFEWIVANADRSIPYADRSFSVVLSITARMNAREFRRVLRDDGRLLVAIPSPEDLIELRGKGRDRVPRTIETFTQDFALTGRRRVTTTASLDAEAVHDALLSIYRPAQTRPTEARQVTFSLDLLWFTALV